MQRDNENRSKKKCQKKILAESQFAFLLAKELLPQARLSVMSWLVEAKKG